jgi:hypothetical protein
MIVVVSGLHALLTMVVLWLPRTAHGFFLEKEIPRNYAKGERCVRTILS